MAPRNARHRRRRRGPSRGCRLAITATVTVGLVTGVARGCGDAPPDTPVTAAHDTAADGAAGHDTAAKNPAPAPVPEPAAPSPTVPPPAAPPPTVPKPPVPPPAAKPAPPKPAPPAPVPKPVPPKPAPAAAKPAPRPPAGSSHPPLPPSPVQRVAVPALTIEAPVVGLGLDPKGHMTAPPVDDPRLVGWYKDGPTPGEAGTALLVGHRDTRTGPAIFLNLNALKAGDLINVGREDRRTAVFTVDAVRTYKKEAFPDAEVYGNKNGRPELRVLTCGGTFDKKTGYASNVVVFAHLTDVKYL